jgi:DNA-binding beta-propeller fold protein YncE
MGIARSDSGWVVCDNSNKRIRLISFAGRVKTIAGIGLLGDGIGENSRFLEPYDVVKHPKKDTIYITDRGNNAIRQIDLKTQTLKTIVGNGNSGNVNGIGDNVVLSRPFNMAISETGDSLYFTEPFSNRIKLLLTKTREVKLLAGTDASGYLDSTIGRFARFNQPQDIALKGNILYVADARNQRIRAVDVLTSRVTTFAGSGSTITGGFKDSTLLFSRFNRPFSLEWVGNKLFIGEDAGLRIRVLYPDSGKVKVWAGSGNIGLTDGLGTAARFFSIQKLSYDPAQNNLFVSGASNLGQLRTVGVTSPTVKTFLNSNGFQNGLLNQAKFLGPTGIFTDVPKKRYLVMDLGNNRIRSINWFPNNAPKAKIDTLLNLIEDQGVVTRPGFGQNLNAGLGVGDTLQKFNFFIGSAVSILNSSLDTLGKLTIETAPDSNGVYTIRILQKDNGGTALGGVDTSVHFVKLRITPVNDPPRFDSLRNDTARYDQPRERIGFLTNFLPGPWDERNQTLTYSITNDQPGLFTTQPFIENGALKFTPNGSMGLVNLKLKAKDNGGTELNGVDSTIKTFTILLVDPTSVEDLKQSKWLAYPNPVRTELRFLNLPQNLSQISWFNVQGQKVAVSEIEWNGNQPGIKVPPKLKGIYQLRTDVGNNNRNLRIVVQ